jgi:hypothetical protein
MALEIGAVKEGKGGQRYVYTGGDEFSKDSWKPAPETPKAPEKSFAASVVGDKAAKFIDDFRNFSMLPRPDLAGMVGKAGYEAGGYATDVATDLGAEPETAAKIGYGTNVVTQAVPSILTGNVFQSAAKPAMQAGGRSIMRSALKPSSAEAISGQGTKAVETLLKEGVNVSPGGARVLAEKISGLSDEVSAMIKQAEQAGVTVSKLEAARRAQDAITKFKAQVNPSGDVQAIKSSIEQFLKHPDLKALDDIPIELAQKMKSGTYSILGSKAYGEVGSASVEGQKAIARGLKEEIEKAVPGVASKNAKQGELLNALELVGKRAAVAGNKNPIGLGALAENPMAAAAFAADRSELLKSILGRFLYSGAPSVLRDTTRAGATGAMTAKQYFDRGE